MARTTRTVYDITDDLTGEALDEATAQHVELTYAGRSVELDLSKANAKKLDDFLAPYLDAGKKVSSTGSSTGKGSAPARPGIILWARENGWPDAKGKPGPEIKAAYDAAHK